MSKKRDGRYDKKKERKASLIDGREEGLCLIEERKLNAFITPTTTST